MRIASCFSIYIVIMLRLLSNRSLFISFSFPTNNRTSLICRSGIAKLCALPYVLLHSMAEVPWLVMEFGETSKGNLLATTTHKIISKYVKYYNIAVVCSARSGTSKSKRTSSFLLEAIYLSTSNETCTVKLNRIIDTIKNDPSVPQGQQSGHRTRS